MTDLTTLRQAFQAQAYFCRTSRSPFSALVLDCVADSLGKGPRYDGFLEPWFAASGVQLFNDAVPLRLLGAFHYLVLSGRAPGLAALYPPQAINPDPAALDQALGQAAAGHSDIIARFMRSPPQTNEVGRSLCLVGGFLTVAAETGLALRCLELGASAGLNMNWDQFAYRFEGGARWGPKDARLELFGDWTGGNPPLLKRVEVVERTACDQNPIDVSDPDKALKLRSYVWADQTLRLERLTAAIAIKRETGGVPERADAADWAEAHAHPKPGVATVVYHSSFMPYPLLETQARIKAALETAGRAASADAPFSWLSKEADRAAPAKHDEVLLRVWRGRPDDGVLRRLAIVHPHGTTVDWLGETPAP